MSFTVLIIMAILLSISQLYGMAKLERQWETSIWQQNENAKHVLMQDIAMSTYGRVNGHALKRRLSHFSGDGGARDLYHKYEYTEW